MSIINQLISGLLGKGKRLSNLEKVVLGCVKEKLDDGISELWGCQLAAINKVQRLPGGVEANFYRMRGGRPSFDQTLAFPNKKEELLVASAMIELAGMGELAAKVWCVKGFVFSITYKGNVAYFEEAAGMEPAPDFKISCDLLADLRKEDPFI